MARLHSYLDLDYAVASPASRLNARNALPLPAMVAMALFAVGCVDTPLSGDTTSSLGKGLGIHGYVPYPNDVVEVRLKSAKTGTYSTFTTVTSSSTVSQTDCQGVKWYAFSKTIDLPQDYLAYYAGNPANVNIRTFAKLVSRTGGDIASFDNTAGDCLNQFCSGLDRMANCKASTSPVINLNVPCGTAGNFCCLKGGVNSQLDNCTGGSLCKYNGACEANNWLTSPDSYLYDYVFPKYQDQDWTEALNGIASDGTFWYFAQEHALLKVALSTNLDQDLRNNSNVIFSGNEDDERMPSWVPSGYDHLGDLDSFGSKLYVPIEGGTRRALIAELNASDLSLLSVAQIPDTASATVISHASWVAINPKNGYLYSSAFDTSVIRVYARSYPGDQLVLTEMPSLAMLDENGNSLKLYRVQGGAFSSSGKLYLSSDNGQPTYGNPGPYHGIYGFQISPNAARLQVHRVTPANYQEKVPIFNENASDEIQGITIMDMTWGSGHRNQIHQIVIDKDRNTDELSLKHFALSDPSKL